MKRQATEKEKLFAKRITNKGLVFRIHKELLLVIKKTENAIEKRARDLYGLMVKEEIRIPNEHVKVLHFICHQRNEE